MAKHKKSLFATIVLATLAAWWMSLPYIGFGVYFLLPVLLLVFAVRLSQAWKYPETRRLQFSRVAIWLMSVAVILTVHHIRAGQWRETADRVAGNIIEYSAREGHCPESIVRWITPAEAKALHLMYACHNSEPGLIYMDSFEAAARYYYHFDTREWEWNSG